MENNRTTVFCISCGCKRSYAITSQKVENTIRDISFEYVEMIAHCTECGEELYVPEVNDSNVESQENAYREAAQLISVSQINKIIEKYRIGAGPLAKIMGFGDVTINRYIGGQLPSRSHSNQLLEILSSYRKMEELLEENKHLISPVAYKKSRDAIDQLNSLYGHEKIYIVARYILNKAANDITPMALQKLLYYAQAFHRAMYDEDLFVDKCQAWARGPVYPHVYFKYRGYAYDPIERPLDYIEEDLLELTTREIDLLDAIVNAFGCYSGTVLSKFTHSERPWLEARGNLSPKDRSHSEIKKEVEDIYFKQVVSNYKIVNPCDIKNYSDAMVRRTCCSF